MWARDGSLGKRKNVSQKQRQMRRKQKYTKIKEKYKDMETQRYNILKIQGHVRTRAVRKNQGGRETVTRDRARKDSDSNTQWLAVFNGENTCELPEKDCILTLRPPWEDRFFGLAECWMV